MFKFKNKIKSFFGLQSNSDSNNPESLQEELQDINLLIHQKEIALSSLSELTIANSIKLKDYETEHSNSRKSFKSKTQCPDVATFETYQQGK